MEKDNDYIIDYVHTGKKSSKYNVPGFILVDSYDLHIGQYHIPLGALEKPTQL